MTSAPPLIALFAVAFTLSGCVSAKYKLAPKDTPPPSILHLVSPRAAAAGDTPSPLVVTLDAVIVYQGPGSWKRNAYWDEYLIAVVNQSAEPLVVESATVVDFQNRRVVCGDNPWTLEKESKLNSERLATAGSDVLKIGGGLAAATAVGVIGGAALGAGGAGAAMSGYGAGLASGVGALAGGVIAIPVFAGATIYRNVSSRHAVEAEFNRRRLGLPFTLAAGQKIEGSLFFRIAPGPQQLIIRSRSGGTIETSINLAPLASLHLKSDSRPAVPSAPQPSR